MGGILEGPAMQDCKESDIWTVTTTVASTADGRKLARELVERRLAACVQLDAIEASVYRWEGRLCEDGEVRLTIKTTGSRVPELQAHFTRSHPYAVPQFTAWPCRAGDAYAQWVRAEVEGDGA